MEAVGQSAKVAAVPHLDHVATDAQVVSNVANPAREPQTGSGGWIRTAGVWAGAIFVSLLAWVFASPVGGSPDEPAHMAYAWGLATGQEVFDVPPGCDTRTQACVTVVDTPLGLIPTPGCHQFQPQVPASCEQARSITAQPSSTIRYPPPYYYLVGWAMRVALKLGVDAEDGGLVGRVASALLVTSLLAPTFVVAVKRLPTLVPFILVLLSPMTLFMGGTINPSGAEIVAAIAVAVGLVAFSRSLELDRWTSLSFVYGIGWLTWARPLGFLWAGAALVFGVLYVVAAHKAKRRFLETVIRLGRVLVPSVLLVITAVGWFVFSLEVRRTDGSSEVSVPDPGLERLVAVPLRWGGMLWESVGVLGWLDTQLPKPVMFTIIGVAATMMGLAAVGSQENTQLRRITLVYLGVIVVGISAIMYRTAFLWQGRYALPSLAIGLLLWGGTASDEVAPQLRKLGIAAWVAASLSGLWLAARYMYGIQIGSRYLVPNFSEDAQWLPAPGGIGMVLLGLLGVAVVPFAQFVTSARNEPTS